MTETMQPEDWAKLKHFKRSDNWGDPDKMSRSLLFELDAFRAFIGRPIVVTCGTQGVHSPKSQHYQGLAVDIVFPGAKPCDLIDTFFAVARFNFNGVGLYPHWKMNGQKVGGMHLDQRVLTPGQHKAQWMAIPITTPEGKVSQQYINLTRHNLIRHGVLGVLA